jgi:alpha-tubulin suppressor-like RCC1 family protein
MLALYAIAGIAQIAVGNGHTCTVHDDGTVRCWGSNSSGELGDGTVEDRLTPTPVVGLTDAVSIAAEQHHTCALRRSGELVCWGEIDSAKQLQPVAFGRDDVVQISGDCFVAKNHRVTCGKVDVAGVANAVAVSADSQNGCLVHASGAVSCWFSPDAPAAVRGVAGAVEVAAAGGVACSRDRDGAVWCWRWALEREKRSPELENMTLPPGPLHQVAVHPKRVVAAGATALAGGFDRVCALSRGELRCWGGDLKPVQMPSLGAVTGLALGRHSCAVRGGHDVVCWGDDEIGQLGSGWAGERPTPLLVPGLHDAVALETSYYTGVVGYQWSCAQRANGKTVCWGNIYPNDPRRANPVPTAAAKMMTRKGDCTLTPGGHVHCDYEPVKQWPGHEAPGITDAVQIALGDMDNCARERSGQVSCWKQATVKRVPGITDAIDIASGAAVCAVRADHSVWCWPGYARNDIVAASKDGTPVKVDGLPPIARISLGAGNACGLAVDGTVWCWGGNSSGQVGDGTHVTRAQPARVPGLDHVAEISAGTAHVCARLANGDVACWGAAGDGQIGTSSGYHFDKPVAVVW